MYTFSNEIRACLESSPVPMAYYEYEDGRWTTLLVSNGLCEMLRMDRENLLTTFNNSSFGSVHPDDVGRVMQICEDFAGRIAGCDIVYRRMCDWDGNYHKIHAVGRRHKIPGGPELVLFNYMDFTDSTLEISQLASSYEFFREDLFYRDVNTGLPNINYFACFAEERVKEIRSRDEIPAIVFLDVNGMHAYNSRFGIDQGDALMRLIAEVLKAEFDDSLLTRGADDHFVLVTAMREKQELIRHIQEANRKVRQGAYGHCNGIRAGVALFDGGEPVPEVLDRAKRAHKWLGTDMNLTCRFYSEAMDEDYRTQTYILENFEKALEEGWIKVFYQGIMRIASGKVSAFEALARWVDPKRGMLSPAQFIPVLEKHHLLHKLDLYMIEQICKEIPRRVELGLPLQPISVNFSAQDFEYLDINQELNRITDRYDLERYGMTRRDFIVEITEQDIAVATEDFRRQLMALRKSGYRIWMDDFGSGYSSLNVLGSYDIDLIKLDMEFLRHLDDNDGTNRHIIRAIVNMARELGIHTLTEGLETEEELAFLQEVGCELAQGFFFLKPKSLDSIAQMLQSGVEPIPAETAEEREIQRRKWLCRETP